MAEDGGAATPAPCMMEDREGTGDGECGKEIWVMGTPVDGGGGGRDRALVMVTPVVGVGGAAWNGGAENGNAEMPGADAGRPEMLP